MPKAYNVEIMISRGFIIIVLFKVIIYAVQVITTNYEMLYLTLDDTKGVESRTFPNLRSPDGLYSSTNG